MNRRNFLKGTLAAGLMTAADWRLFAEQNDLPAYYGDMLADVVRRVRARAAEGRDAFWFITDAHVHDNHRQSGRLLARLIRETGVSKVFFGGDIPCAFGTRAKLDDALALFRTHWIEPIEKAGGRLYLAKGNHDFTIRESMQSQNGATLDGKAARAFLLSTKAASSVSTNGEDPEGAYFFFDEPEARLRYVFADTTDSIVPRRPYWAVASGVHARQLDWLRDRAFATLPEGYEAIVVHHIPITGVVGGEKETRTFANLRALVSAPSSRVILDLTGHEHREGQTYQDGVWHVTEPCDAAYSDYIAGSRPWCPDLPKKKAGTRFEQTFDAVIVGRGREPLHFVRVGGGADRSLGRESVRIDVGATHAFATALPDVTWGAYDADGVNFRKDPANRWGVLLDFRNEVASIDAKGVLTARRAGESVIVARAADGRKELTPARIVGPFDKSYTLHENGTILFPGVKGTSPLRFWVASDTHFAFHDARDDAYAGNYARMAAQKPPLEDFKKMLAAAKKAEIDLLVLTGDILSFPTLANVETLKASLDESGVPWLYVAGNHDWHFEGDAGSDIAQRALWTAERLKPLYQGANPLMASRVVKGVRFVAIDNSVYHVLPEQVAFFKAEAAKGEPLFLFQHIPLWAKGLDERFYCASPKWGAAIDPYWQIERRERWSERLMPSTYAYRDAVLKTPNLAAVFAGHIHRLEVVSAEGQNLFTVPRNAKGFHFDVTLG